MNPPAGPTAVKYEPYWWDDLPDAAISTPALPSEVDVVVVGSGYTGLHAALQTSRHGLGTLVLDAEALGYGCSTRNGGQVSTSIKGTYPELAKKYGDHRARRLLQEGVDALNYIETFIAEEGIDCAWERCGHFTGAHNAAAYTSAARALEALPNELGIEWHMIPTNEQHREIGSERYQGGVVYPQHAALHPALYHSGLLARVRASGAVTKGHCAVLKIEPTQNGFRVHTTDGVVRAGQVAIATNGYTKPVTPWLRRRVIPIGSYIIATEPLDEDLAHQLSPHNRTITDTRKLVFYYRLCPQRRRMIFGGRVAVAETDPRASAPALHAAMTDIFPQLSNTPISHSWLGFVGYTFDTLPHIGQHDGVHYAMGYCGSGISLASYCGSVMGSQICGHDDRRLSFMDMKFQTRPFYKGDPWFLKPSVLYYKLRDRWGVS